MRVSEFMGWMAYAEREAFGNDIDRLQQGLIASTIANVNRDPKKRPQPYQPKDFTVCPPATPYISPEFLEKKIGRKI